MPPMTEPSATSTAAESPAKVPAATAATSAASPNPRLVTVNNVNWANVLDFAHVFRGFRLAINPAKLLLALLAILAIYVAGRGFDVLWGHQVYADEMQRFTTERPQVYDALREIRLKNRTDQLDRMLLNVPGLSPE